MISHRFKVGYLLQSLLGGERERERLGLWAAMGPCQKVALVVLTLLGVLPFITAHELPSNTTWLGEHGPSASSAAALKLMDTHLEDLSAFDAAVSGHLMTSDINYMNQTGFFLNLFR